MSMLIDWEYRQNKKMLITSYVDKKGDIKLKHFNWDNPRQYISCPPDDPDRVKKYRSWDNKPVKLSTTYKPDRFAVYEFLDSLPKEETEEIFGYSLAKIYFIDIETEILPDSFPDAETAPTRVLSISIVYDNKIILLGLRDMPQDMQDRIKKNTNDYIKSAVQEEYDFKYVKFDSEFDMLYAFFNKMVPKMPIITGWYFLDYDWLYLCNRAVKLNIDPAVSSITKKMKEIFDPSSTVKIKVPLHRMIFDYMMLYEILDTSIKVKESSSLDFVAKKLVGLEKIKYNGSLQKLYDEDFETFMFYNAVDSVLVQLIHKSRNYISIVFAISSLSRIRVTDVISKSNNGISSIPITEGVLRGRFRDDGIVLFKDPTNVQSGQGAKIEGGWVKDPVPGLNQWVVVYDFSSLYPHVQMQWYIAPENFVGIKDDRNPEYCTNGKQINPEEHVVCVNGVVFMKRISPTISMLMNIFGDRKTAKKTMMKKKNELDEVQREIKKLQMELTMEQTI